MKTKPHKVDPQILAAYPNCTLKNELIRTAEDIATIAESQGTYFAVAYLYDAGYDPERMKQLLPILEKSRGAIKRVATNRNCA